MVSVRQWLHGSTALTSAGLVLIFMANAVSANPTDGQVVAGEATISTPDPSTLLINQHSQNVVLEWGSFNIDAGETTTFVQPNVDAWALNRVVGSQDPSVIAGALNANGNIAIVNPDGIVFSREARVDVGGLVATTADIDNNAFMRGELRFNLPGNPAASIINEGTVSIRDHGLAAFVAPGVRNSGVITARFGTVSLASGNTFALDLYGDGLVSLAIGDEITEDVIDVATGAVMADLVKNEGTISANGGTVALTAATARTAVNSVINNTGVIEANTVGMRNGKIILGAQTADSRGVSAPRQTVRVSGTISAAAPTRSIRPAARPTSGGTIQITGEDIQVTKATIDASGAHGGGKILIGGDYLGGRAITALFPLGEEVREDYEVPTAATVSIDADTSITASATDDGDGGKIILWSDEATTTSANILAYGAGQGTGGFIETSSAGVLSLPEGFVSAGQGGTWLLDPRYITVGDADSVDGETQFVSAATISTSLNSGTNVQLMATGENAELAVYRDILKTSGGDAQLLLGSTGSVRIAADIISTSGKLDVGIVTADVYDDYDDQAGQLLSIPSGRFQLDGGNTINTNGGNFGFRGAQFMAVNATEFLIGEDPVIIPPGRIVTEGGNMTFVFAPETIAQAGFAGFFGCDGSSTGCGLGSDFVLDAGSGRISFAVNDQDYEVLGTDDLPEVFVGDRGIRTTGELRINDVVVKSNRPTNRNGIHNVEFGTLTLLNDAVFDFPFADVPGLENFYSAVPVPGVTLPVGTYRVGERIIIELPTLFTSPNSAIRTLTVSGPSGGSYQILGNELVIDYNGPPGPINLTFRATTFAGNTTDLVLSLNIQAPVTPPPVDHPPTLVGSIPTLPNAEIGAEYAVTTPVLFADDNGVGGLRLEVSGLPAGLTATDNRNGTVTISGTPTTAGAITFTVTATDAGGNAVSTNGRFTVNDIRVVVIRPQDEPGVFVSLGFSSDQREEFENTSVGLSALCEQTGTCWNSNAVNIIPELRSALSSSGTFSTSDNSEIANEIESALNIAGYLSFIPNTATFLSDPLLQQQIWKMTGGDPARFSSYLTTSAGKQATQKAVEAQAGLVKSGAALVISILADLMIKYVESEIDPKLGKEWAAYKIAINSAEVAAIAPLDPLAAALEASKWAVEDIDRTVRLTFALETQNSEMRAQVETMRMYVNLQAAAISERSGDMESEEIQARSDAIAQTLDTMRALERAIENNPGLQVSEFFVNGVFRPISSAFN